MQYEAATSASSLGIRLEDILMDYTVRKSARARLMRITVRADERVIVTIPKRVSEEAGRLFFESKRVWIEGAILKLRKRKKQAFDIPRATARDYALRKDEALLLVLRKLEHFNKIYNLSWNRVSIKNTSSRWGSCSKRGNLNFNYRIVYLPEAYADYLIVHELCHLKEFNHSQAFWNLVGKTIPDYKTLRKEMRIL